MGFKKQNKQNLVNWMTIFLPPFSFRLKSWWQMHNYLPALVGTAVNTKIVRMFLHFQMWWDFSESASQLLPELRRTTNVIAQETHMYQYDLIWKEIVSNWRLLLFRKPSFNLILINYLAKAGKTSDRQDIVSMCWITFACFATSEIYMHLIK